MTWPCFWVEETGDVQLSLRRFTFGVYHGATPGDGYHDDRPDHVACPAEGRRPVQGKPGVEYQGGHDASVDIEQAPMQRTPEGFIGALQVEDWDGDERWPTSCTKCGEAMPEGAIWQVNQERIYAEAHHGDAPARAWQQRDLPPGAMFDGYWYPQKGTDGIALCVVLPGKGGAFIPWHVDGRAGNQPDLSKPGWTRTGDPKANPPTVSATPSILVGGTYHGYLTNGVLTDDLDGNTFD